jgi:tRNA 2-thiouridine synthesizing protein A
MFEVDCLGLSCPLPVVRTQKAMKEHPVEELLIKVDIATAREHITRLAQDKGYKVEVSTKGDEIHLRLTPPAK